MRKKATVASIAALLAMPAVAEAHVTLQPDEVPAGGFTRLDVRVPNERANASTTKVEIRLPAGFASVSTEPVPGWTIKQTEIKLAKPQTNAVGETITDRVATITWTSDGKHSGIGPGEFQDFGVSVAIPDKPRTSLTFKAIQTYSNGEVVRWIGPPGSDEPAPQVELTAPSGGVDEPVGIDNAEASAGPEVGSAVDDDSGAPVWLAVLAVAVGLCGLAVGASALRTARKRAGA